MNREEAIRAMLDGKKVKQQCGSWPFYLNDYKEFVYKTGDGTVCRVDLNDISSEDWELYEEPKPKKRYMTREEVLGFVCNTPGIVVRHINCPWESATVFFYDADDVKNHEYAYIDKSGNIGEPHKFMVDEY